MRLYAPDYVVLFVEDLDRSLAFYVGKLGLFGRNTTQCGLPIDTPVKRSLREPARIGWSTSSGTSSRVRADAGVPVA